MDMNLSSLSPLETGGIIRRIFQFYRAHFRQLFTLALLVYAFHFLVGLLMTWQQGNEPRDAMLQALHSQFPTSPLPPASSANSSHALLTTLDILSFLVTLLGFIALTDYTARLYLGQKPSRKDSFAVMIQQGIPVLWTYLLRAFFLSLTAIPALIDLVVAAWLWQQGSRYASDVALFSLVLIAPFFILFLRFLLYLPVVVLEKEQGLDALKQSSRIASYSAGKGFWGWGGTRISLVWLVIFLLFVVLITLSSIPVMYASARSVWHGQLPDYSLNGVMWVTHIACYITYSLIAPLYVAASVVYYFDIRVRQTKKNL